MRVTVVMLAADGYFVVLQLFFLVVCVCVDQEAVSPWSSPMLLATEEMRTDG